MATQEKAPKAAKTAMRASSIEESNVGIKDTSVNVSKQALAEVFAAVLDHRVWVVSGSNKAPRDAEGEPFSEWSSPATVLSTYAEARATADKHGLPHIGLVFPASGIVVDGWRLLCIDVDEVEGYRKRQPEKPGKPGCTAITFDPIADAAAVLARVPLVAQLPQTVWEASCSNTSIHGFVWVPADQEHWGRRGAKLTGCKHVDTFIAGRKAAHLITTGVSLSGCTTIAKLGDITKLQPLLQPAGDPKGPAELIIPDEGEPFDLIALSLTEPQTQLVKGTFTGDRSPVMRSLLMRLIDAGKSPGDLLASLCANDATREYLLDHRNQDPARAIDFARYEIAGAYKKSITGKMAINLGFAPAWKDGELLIDPAEASTDFEQDSWRNLTREDGRTTLDDLHEPVDPWPHVAGPSRPMKCFSIMGGAGGTGKSTEALGEDLCIACGLPYRGMPTIQGVSVFVSVEDSRDIIKARVQAWLKGVPAELRPRVEADLQKNFFFFGNDEAGGMQLTVKEFAVCKPSREAVEKLCEIGKGAVSITVETIAMLNGGDEMNPDFMQVALALKEVALRTGANVRAVHHLPKEAMKTYPPTAYSLRGAAALSDAMRGCTIMVELPDKEYTRLCIPRICDEPVFALHNVKASYSKQHAPIYLRRLEGPRYIEVVPRHVKDAEDAPARLLTYLHQQKDGLSLRQLKEDCARFWMEQREVEGALLGLEKEGKVERIGSKELKRKGPAHDVWRALIESQA